MYAHFINEDQNLHVHVNTLDLSPLFKFSAT